MEDPDTQWLFNDGFYIKAPQDSTEVQTLSDVLPIVDPVLESSGQTRRYRLNRGGDRSTNSALHIIAIGGIHYDPVTKTYVKKRTEQGFTKLKIIRCLKRYVAREVYHIIRAGNRAINGTNRHLTFRRASTARR